MLFDPIRAYLIHRQRIIYIDERRIKSRYTDGEIRLVIIMVFCVASSVSEVAVAVSLRGGLCMGEEWESIPSESEWEDTKLVYSEEEWQCMNLERVGKCERGFHFRCNEDTPSWWMYHDGGWIWMPKNWASDWVWEIVGNIREGCKRSKVW